MTFRVSWLRRIADRPPAVLRAGRHTDDGLLEILIGAGVGVAFFVILLGWAAFARLDQAAYAQGEVTVADHRQNVQHKEGGIVSALYVKDGQKVAAGQLLMELSGADAKAQESALAAQVYGLQAQQARLQAEQFGLGSIPWPATLTSALGDEKLWAGKAMKIQEAQFKARAAALFAQNKVLLQKTIELHQQEEGFRRQIESTQEQSRLIGEELQGVKALAAEGFAPLTRVRSLERDQAELIGRTGQFSASVAQAQEQSGEARLQILQLSKQHAEDIASQLRDVEFQLNDAQPKLIAARDLLSREQVRAPAGGAVVNLSVFTVGAVIAPGQTLMDIVPDRSSLVVQARMSPSDVDQVRVGRGVEIKLPSLRDRGLPTLSGVLTKLSADRIIDERTGASYFQVEAAVDGQTLDRLKLAEDGQFQIKPGLPAQVLIPLRRRTALQYILQPLTDAIWRSFREK